MKLLGTNSKLSKLPNGMNYLVKGLAIAPHSLGDTKTVCPGSTEACRNNCNLWHAGRTVMPVTRSAMLKRKEFLLASPAEFTAQLVKEIRLHEKRALAIGAIPLIRLNVSSDLDWSAIIRQFPGVRFYDYTKVHARARKNTLGNYDLTYSRSERTTDKQVTEILSSGGNVAVVFAVEYFPAQGRIGDLPKTYLGFPVVDGDKHDFRLPEIDGRGVVVGLRLKGGTKEKLDGVASGFAVEVK